jgi:hypothetical protein
MLPGWAIIVSRSRFKVSLAARKRHSQRRQPVDGSWRVRQLSESGSTAAIEGTP